MAARLADLLTIEAISPRLAAQDRAGVLTELATLLARSSELSAADLAAALAARERIGSTGSGDGVGLPHCKLAGLRRVHVCLGVSAPGIDFAAPDHRPVHVLVGLASPADAAGPHLLILSRVAGLFKHSSLGQELLRNREAATMKAVLLDEEERFLRERRGRS